MVLAICLFPMIVSAQDVITLKNGDEIQAKVTEVMQDQIKYKRFDNLDGPVYFLNKSEIFMIKYQNGQKDVFKDEKPAQDNASGSNKNEDGGEFWKPYYWTNQRIAGISPFVDLGGFAFTGPRAGIEFRYRRFWVNAFYKYGGIGAMNTLYLDDNEIYNPAQDIEGHGGGFTVKFLFPLKNSNSAFHVGVINEWANYSCWFADPDLEIEWESTFVGSSGLGVGYSYHTNKGFYFTFGGYWGISAFNLEFTRTYIDDDGSYGSTWRDWDDWIDFFGIAEITLGWEICVARKK
ncbi:MAG TPA: hypothetical protein PLW70_00780 [Bacteroidales bacterium]|nr:hypothetical protein [Bacteroidales bacterium]